MVVLCAVFLHLCGCGTAFTGDGIPPGRSVIVGRVVQAANSQVSVPNATVTITATVVGRSVVAGRGTSQYIVYTDNQGMFAVNGIGTDQIASTVSVSVVPQDTSLQSQKIVFSLANGRPTDLIVSLPPTTLALNKVANVVLTEIASTNGAVPSAQYRAQVFDAQGDDLGIIPTLVFDGGAAIIASDGTFTVTPAPGVTIPVVSSPLGTVTATVDTHQSSGSPTTTVTPAIPTTSISTSGGAAVPTAPPSPPKG
jgi:hypothetical protein